MIVSVIRGCGVVFLVAIGGIGVSCSEPLSSVIAGRSGLICRDGDVWEIDVEFLEQLYYLEAELRTLGCDEAEESCSEEDERADGSMALVSQRDMK